MRRGWDEVERDPRLAAEVRARYTGGGDALDHLWWLEHPGRPTPAGVADPAEDLEAARRALYRADASGDPAAVQAAESRHRRDADLARAALEGALADRRAAVASGDGRTAPTGSRRPRALVPLLAAVAGIAVGASVAAWAAAQQAPVPDRRALAVFTDAQRPETDLADAAAAPPFLVRRTLRRLHDWTSIGTSAYAARDDRGAVCLLVVVLGSRASTACTSERAFALGGLKVLTTATADPVDDAGTTPSEDLEIAWAPDGTVAITPLDS